MVPPSASTAAAVEAAADDSSATMVNIPFVRWISSLFFVVVGNEGGGNDSVICGEGIGGVVPSHSSDWSQASRRWSCVSVRLVVSCRLIVVID